MKRESKKRLKRLRTLIEGPRNDLFDFLRELHDNEEITTKQYIDATTATYALTDVFKVFEVPKGTNSEVETEQHT